MNSNPVINPVLRSAASPSRLQVTTNVAMAETHDSSISQVIDQQRIVDLPLNGRQATQLILLSGLSAQGLATDINTSKNYQSASVTISIAGSQPNTNNFVMDGGDNNDAFSNVNKPFPFPDALQEFNVQTSALQARYGLHSGGVVSLVTKSGSQRDSRRSVRVPAQRRGQRTELLRSRARRAEAQPVRRHGGRPDPEEQAVLLRRLPGNAHQDRPGHHDQHRARPRRC